MDGLRRVPAADAALLAAITRSRLRALAMDLVTELLADATRIRLPAGAILRSAGDQGSHLELIVAGLVRVFVLAPDGRTLTVRYCRDGDLLGVASLFHDAYLMPGSIQTLEATELVAIRAATAKHLAAVRTEVAGAFLDELSDRVVSFVGEISGSAFATVRQRVARHLLDLARVDDQGRDLVASVSQQDLADAVGTAREVVVRVLRELRVEGIVATGRDGIRVRAPSRLYAERFALEASEVRDAS
jgi:CRP/FNR family transcriptional regulator, cyclic AMP receptor protein